MKYETTEVIRQVSEFLESHRQEAVAGPLITPLLKQHPRLSVEVALGRFMDWILLQKVPSCRTPHDLPPKSLDIVRQVVGESFELSALFDFTERAVDFRPDVSLEMREALRSIVRELYHAEVTE